MREWLVYAVLAALTAMAFTSGWTFRGWYSGMELHKAQDQYTALQYVMHQETDRLQKKLLDTAASVESTVAERILQEHQQQENLQNAITTSSFVKEADVSKQCKDVDDPRLEHCPVQPSVDWRLFQGIYNQGSGNSGASPDSGSDPQGAAIGHVPLHPRFADDPRRLTGNVGF